MPQVKQLQLVYWGPFRPDPIELAVDGINVFAGLNGVGKTCLLDAIKLMLGVDDLKAKPAEYIYNGGDNGGRVDRAYIKAVFDNPVRSRSQGRVFADAGRGCGDTLNVTAICEVSRTGSRRYAIFPGYQPWGGPGRNLPEDLAKLAELPHSRWLGPRQWSELLARAGVPRALLGVIALKQGETDKALSANPEQLLRQMLELTGKQQTLDDFRAAKQKLAETRRQYEEAWARFESERRQLTHLKHLVDRYREFEQDSRRLKRIQEVELPLARRRKVEKDLAEARNQRDQREGQLQAAWSERAELEREIPELEERERQLGGERKRLRGSRDDWQAKFDEAAKALGGSESALEGARALVQDAETIAPLSQEMLASLDQEAAAAVRDLEDAETEDARLQRELGELYVGKPPRPDGQDEFRALLESHGIGSELIAERLELGEALAAEAVLGDGVWTLIVAADRFEDAVELARGNGYRLPIARAGAGEPHGVFAGASGLPEALAYLAELDLEVGAVPGVERDGLVRGREWAAFRAPEQLALGEAARAEAIAVCEARRTVLAGELLCLREQKRTRARAARVFSAGVSASNELAVLAEKIETIRQKKAQAERERGEAQRILDESGPELGRLEEGLKQKREQLRGVQGRIDDLEPRVKTLGERVSELEAQLKEIPLTLEQEEIKELPSADVLESQRDDLFTRLQRYAPEEQSRLVLAEHQEQSGRVAEVEVLLADRKADLLDVSEQLERAKQSYDLHIQQTVANLNRAFREICEQAGMEGELQLRPSLTQEDERALDVRVAHLPGDPKLSYQHHTHSGGQKAKISILLLLAAMSAEGAADLLIVDEHSAHLDSPNIDYVSEVMRALRSRVQFILALPSNAEARRLEWCDQQFVLLPRRSGEPYAPKLQLITKEPEPEDRYAEIGQLELAG